MRKLMDRREWPEIRVTLLPLPWSWRRPRIHWDDINPLGLVDVECGPLWLSGYLRQDDGSIFFEREAS